MAKPSVPRSAVVRALVVGLATGLAVAWSLGLLLPVSPWKLPREFSDSSNTPPKPSGGAGSESGVTTLLEDSQDSAVPEAVGYNNAGVAFARRRQWPQSAEHLRHALRLDPGNDSMRRNLQQVLLAWGVDEFHAGRLAAAAELLREASELQADPEVEYWLGQAWLHQGEAARAQGIWEKALLQFSDHPRLLLALAELSEQRDDRPRALDYLTRARAAGLDSPELRQKIERLSREVDAEWEYVTTRSARFDFRHPAFDDAAVLDLVISGFEDAYDSLLRRLGAGPAAPVRVVLYPSSDFYAVTRSPDWAGGVYTGRIQLPIGGLRDSDRGHLERVARHELAHALVTEWSRNRAPAWLQEGLAMWCEDDHPGERWHWAEGLQTEQEGVSLHTLPQSFSALEKHAAEVAYAASYLAVVSLSEQYGMHRVLGFVRATAEQPWRDAFSAAFGQSFDDFAASLR